MGPTINHGSAIICAENISVLFLLHSVPSLPARNTLETQKHFAQGYALSLGEERQLVESLAFLANDSDDVNHIPALCVEQHPTTSSLNVSLAVNSTEWQSGHQSLRRLKEGFEKIFMLLADIGQQTENDISSAIVSMCIKRILLRLRLSQSKRSPSKPTIQHILRSTIDCLGKLGMKNSHQRFKLSSLFIEKARRVIKLADAWVNYQTCVQLSEVVDAVYCLKRAVDTDALLGSMTTRDMDPSSRKSLVNIINKIARYREIARCLYRMSKKSTLLRSMRLTTINLPIEAHARPPTNCGTSTLETVIMRARPSCHKADITRTRRLIDTTDCNVDQQLASQVKKILTESKIHAEIQLLYYFELNPSSLPPRVIASSKDACFLCNAFILMHGKMHTARTHGRLYPGWRLPSIQAFASLEHRFNVVLASQINASLSRLLSRGKRIGFADPNESTLLTLPHSASTLRSLSIAQDEATGQESVTPFLVSTAKTEINRVTTTSTFEEESEEESGQSEEQSNIGPMSVGRKQVNSVTSGNPVSTVAAKDMLDSPSQASIPAISNASSEVEGCVTVPESSKRLFRAGRLHLYMESPVQTVLLQHAQSVENVTYLVEWLDDMEAERQIANEGATMTDVEQLANETTYEADHHGRLFIAARGVVVRITVRTGNDHALLHKTGNGLLR